MNVSTLLDLNFGKCPQPARHSARASFGLAAIGMGFRSPGAPAPVTKDHPTQSLSASGKIRDIRKKSQIAVRFGANRNSFSEIGSLSDVCSSATTRAA
jgi:hypothetical protein